MDEQIAALAKVPKQTAELLNPKENYDYGEYRKQLYWWLLTYGKDPEQETGYAIATVKNRGYLIDRFYSQLWEQDGEYRTLVSHEEADAWFDTVIASENTNSYKNSWIKALQSLFKFQHHLGTELWTPPFWFSDDAQNPRDYLTRSERTKIRTASLSYGEVPNPQSLSPDEQDRWEAYLAQRYEKPKSDITVREWERANS